MDVSYLIDEDELIIAPKGDDSQEDISFCSVKEREGELFLRVLNH